MENVGNMAMELSYKYPFCSYSKVVLEGHRPDQSIEKYLSFGRERIQNDINMKNRYYEIGLNDVKLGELKSYVYSRMIVSAIKNPYLIERFCRGEAHRSKEALVRGDADEILYVGRDVGVSAQLDKDGLFVVSLSDFLKNSPKREEFKLVNNNLNRGEVFLARSRVIELIEEGIYKKVRSGLPIPLKELPKLIVEGSRGMNFDMQIRIPKQKGRNTGWIELVLGTPIPDVRHRTINLILAPYLTNIKGLDIEQATKVIADYIEECKKLNPDTKVNTPYIRYQCRYAKEHNLKPLSITNAKALLGSFVRFE